MGDDTFAADVAAFLHRHGPSEAARLLGTSARNVERWAAGKRSPRPETRARVVALLGAPSTPAPVPPTSSPPVEAPPAPVDASDPRAVAAATVAALRVELERLGRDPSASARERASVASSLTSATRLLARLSGSFEITEKMILRTPHWKRITATIIEALKPFGEKPLLACADALHRLDAEETKR